MANPNAPHGLQPVGYINGAPWNGKTNLYYIPSTDAVTYYIGDPVTTTVAGNTSDANGVPQIQRFANGAVTSSPLRGVIVGFQVAPVGINQGGMVPGNNVNLNISYVPATKAFAYYALVADDPNLLFEIQGDNSGTLANTAIGNNAGFTQAAPGTVTGPVSGTVLTTGTIAATAAFALKIISLAYRPNVDFTANAPLIVMINNHELGHGTGTVGHA